MAHRRRGAGPAVALAAGIVIGLLIGQASPRLSGGARAAPPPPARPGPIIGAPAVRPPGPALAGPTPATRSAPPQAPAPAGQPPPGTAPASLRHDPQTFEAPAGLVLHFIRAGRADAFESLTGRLLDALAASEDETRQAQAAGWTTYKAREPGPNNNVLYLWLLDPAVADADYGVPRILGETLPAEAQQLYETYTGAFGTGQTWLNLDPVDLSAGAGAGGAADRSDR